MGEENVNGTKTQEGVPENNNGADRKATKAALEAFLDESLGQNTDENASQQDEIRLDEASKDSENSIRILPEDLEKKTEEGKGDDGQEGKEGTAQKTGTKEDNQGGQQDVQLPKGFKSMEAWEKSYKHMQSRSSKAEAENSQLKSQMDNLAAEVESLRKINENIIANFKPTAEEKAKEKEMTPEEIEELNQKELDALMNNPTEYWAKRKSEMIKEIEDKYYKPIQEKMQTEEQQRKWNEKVTQFAQAVDPDTGELVHSDFVELAPKMQQLLDKHPAIQTMDNPIDTLYSMAKMEQYTADMADSSKDNKKVDPAELLKDEEFLKSHVLSNEEIKKKIIADYVKQISEGKPPAQINNSKHGGSSPPTTPAKKFKTIKEAGKALLERLG